jgi:hypothetical protein
MTNFFDVLKCVAVCAMLVLVVRACNENDVNRMKENTQRRYDRMYWDAFNNLMTNPVVR